jgi:hypothetical protein
MSVVIGFLGQLQSRDGTFHLAISTWEAPEQTGTIQNKIVIWIARQPVKDEPTVSFPTPQEATSCMELADSILLEIQG